MRDYDQSTGKAWTQDHERRGVISASSTIIGERNIALNGDMAWCPKETCNGAFQIHGIAQHGGSG